MKLSLSVFQQVAALSHCSTVVKNPNSHYFP